MNSRATQKRCNFNLKLCNLHNLTGALFLLLGASASATDIYSKVGPQLKTAMLDCPARIWPAYDWRKMNVLLLEEGASSQVWRGVTGTTENLPEDQVPDGARAGLYSFFSWHGEDAVSIYVDSSTRPWTKGNTLFELMVHEGFHSLGQRTWVARGGQRGTTYPVELAPRLYRRKLFDRLENYYQSNGADQRSLEQAAFWFQRWKAEFPEEFASSTDRCEGTARYVEYLSLALAEEGCASSEEALRLSLTKKITDPQAPEHLGRSVSGNEFSLSSEGYDIGGLAAFILRLVQKDPNWFSAVASGDGPVEILLKNISPATDTFSPTLEKDFRNTQNAQNRALAQWIEPEIKKFKDPNYLRIAFSQNSMKGSYSPEGFYSPTVLPKVVFEPLASPYTFQNQTWSFRANAKKVLVSSPGPCKNTGFMTLSPLGDALIKDGKIKVQRADLNGEMPGTVLQDAAGLTWFCGD